MDPAARGRYPPDRVLRRARFDGDLADPRAQAYAGIAKTLRWPHKLGIVALFGTYRDQPQLAHERMIIGIHTFRDPKGWATLPGMLVSPFVGKVTDYAINPPVFLMY